MLTSQLCGMLTKACLVDNLGIVPNCRGSIFCNTAGLTYFSSMWSSAGLDKIGVREMGRRCLLISLMGLCFETGTTSASFQDGGRWDSWNEEMRISDTGPAKRSAFSFNNHTRMPSGPCALEELSADSFIKGRKRRYRIVTFVVVLWWVKRIVGEWFKTLHWSQKC